MIVNFKKTAMHNEMPVNFKKTAMYKEMHGELFYKNFDEKCINLSQCMRILGLEWGSASNKYPSPAEIANMIMFMRSSLFEDFYSASYECLSILGGRFTIKSGGLEMTLYYNLEKMELNGIDLTFDIWNHKAC